MRSIRRRTFLQTAAAAVAAAATPVEESTVKLGFDSYSVRAFQWKAPRLLDYAASQKLDTIQFSSLDDYESREPAYLAKVKDQAARLRISIDAGMGCICPSSKSFSKNGPPARDRLLDGLRIAKAVGAASMRCYLGSSADRLPIDPHIENTINLFKSVRSETLDIGVKIALENHSGDLQAREVKTIIEESGKDFVASCLDTGNPIWCIEDPFVTLEILGPYVVTTHVRDSCVFEVPRGAAGQWVALGDGNIDLVRFMEQFRKLCPNSSMQLEIITGRPPTLLPVFRRGFLEGVPQDARVGVRALRRVGKARTSFHGRDGDRRCAGTAAARDERSAQRTTAHRSGTQLRVRQKKVKRRDQLALVALPGYSLLTPLLLAP